jgi:hypothetical protein
MQPQHKKKKPPKTQVTDGRAPITELGQKYVAPPGRHSQQTHRLAQERAEAAGNTEKEQHAHDRAAVTTGIADRAEAKKLHKERSSGK